MTTMAIALPNSPHPEQIADLAVQAEELGYRAAWLAEHILPPQQHLDPSYHAAFEPLICLSFIAARTRRIRLGTSVLVLPLRDPFLTAKQAASLDLLSGGRLELGLGVGWDAEEAASVGSDFHTRGARADEAIKLIRHLLSGTPGPFEGRFYSYERGFFEPVRPDGIPITIGGYSEPALRRAIRIGDGWQSIHLEGAGTDPGTFAEMAGRIKAETDGRVKTTIKLYPRDDRGVEEAIAAVPEWREAGADEIVAWFGEVDGFDRRQERFAEAVGLTAVAVSSNSEGGS